MRSLLLLAVLLAPQEAPSAGASGVRVADALYPCRASATVVRHFELDDDEPDLGALRPALDALGAELVYGPRTTSGRPGHAFVAVRAPRERTARELAAALRKGGSKAQELAVLAFDGRTGSDHDFGMAGLGVTKRDFVMGLSGDVVWYDAAGEWSQLFGPPGKLEAPALAKRYASLYEPYGGATIGAVVLERFSWTLASAPDEKLRAKVLAALERTQGVSAAKIDGAQLTLTVRLDGLLACGDVGPVPADAETLDATARAAPRVAFDAGAVYARLHAARLVE